MPNTSPNKGNVLRFCPRPPRLRDAVISVWFKGQFLVACDAACHSDTTTPPDSCSCICYGANHGVGLKRAKEIADAHGKAWFDRYWEENGRRDFSALLGWTGPNGHASDKEFERLFGF